MASDKEENTIPLTARGKHGAAGHQDGEGETGPHGGRVE